LETGQTFDQSLIEEMFPNAGEVNRGIQSRLGHRSNIILDQMSDAKANWRNDCLGSFPNGQRTYFGDKHPEISLEAFAEMHPDFWMAQHCIGTSYFAGIRTFQAALRFAHVLLQDGDRTQYRVGPDEVQDAAIYEYIGLCGASKTGSQLAITEIPGLVHYSIHEYDGQETVEYGF
jgi:hypothetical protein